MAMVHSMPWAVTAFRKFSMLFEISSYVRLSNKLMADEKQAEKYLKFTKNHGNLRYMMMTYIR